MSIPSTCPTVGRVRSAEFSANVPDARGGVVSRFGNNLWLTQVMNMRFPLAAILRRSAPRARMVSSTRHTAWLLPALLPKGSPHRSAHQGPCGSLPGAFGDSSYGIEKSLLARDETQAVSDVTGQAYTQGFDRATSAREAAMNRLYQIFGGYQGLDKQATDKTAGVSQLLAGLSDKERQVRQSGNDAAYQEALRKQKYPYEQVAFLNQILNSTPIERGQTRDQNTSGKKEEVSPNTGGWDILGKLIGAAGNVMIPGMGSMMGAGKQMLPFGSNVGSLA